MILHKFREIILLLSMIWLAGCTPQAGGPPIDIEESAYSDSAGLQTETEDPVRHGTIQGKGIDTLDEDMQSAILNYMERYYQSIASLSIKNSSDLYAESAEIQELLDRSAWEYMIGLRSGQEADLRLADYSYDLTMDGTAQTERGIVTVSLTEHSIQNFMQHPDIDSELFNIQHRFVLKRQDGDWFILEHRQSDGIYYNVMGNFWNSTQNELPDTDYFKTRKDMLLQQNKEQISLRAQDHASIKIPQTEYPYERDSAVAYASEWIGKRNQEWSDFTGRGGNCQNFVSQCLLAGGIPIDIEGEPIWKWFGEDLNERNDCEGNSSSWISVNGFYQYASTNRGYGLSAVPDAPYQEGVPGDILQMGFPGNWNHVVLISEVIQGEDGHFIDYLVHSNTSDLRNFPASAYPLPCQSLIKICGWNGHRDPEPYMKGKWNAG